MDAPEAPRMPRSTETQGSRTKDSAEGGVAVNHRPSGRNTLSVVDNRTGKSYEIPIENGTIRALA